MSFIITWKILSRRLLVHHYPESGDQMGTTTGQTPAKNPKTCQTSWNDFTTESREDRAERRSKPGRIPAAISPFHGGNRGSNPHGNACADKELPEAFWNPCQLTPQLPQRLFLIPVLGKGMMAGSSASRPNRTRVVISV
jgi:hypothetical protein